MNHLDLSDSIEKNNSNYTNTETSSLSLDGYTPPIHISNESYTPKTNNEYSFMTNKKYPQ